MESAWLIILMIGIHEEHFIRGGGNATFEVVQDWLTFRAWGEDLANYTKRKEDLDSKYFECKRISGPH